MDEIQTNNQELPKNESMTTKISPDKMTAFVTFHSPENNGKMITKEEIEDYLRIEGITKGINQDLLNDLADGRTYEVSYAIAKGKECVKGQDGKIVYNFSIDKKAKPKEREDGSVDFYDLNLISNVNEGDVLAEVIPPTDGEEGYNVLGETLYPTKPKPAFVKKGRNVGISEDGFKVIALKSGQVNIIDEKIVVNEIYEVAADVSTSTGNVNFVGSIVIRGNVLSGFKVYAAGNIDVYGVVEGAIIEAKGNINLHKGVLGGSKAEIKAGGDIIAKYIENCTVNAGGNIISEAILHSNVRCSQNVEINGKNGLLVGGIITAGKSIKAKVIGSELGTHTEIKVGIDPNLVDSYKKDKDEIERLIEEKRKSGQIIELLQGKARKNMLDNDKLEMLSKALRTSENIDKRIEELMEEQELLKQKIEEIENGEIKVEQKIFSNVEIYVSTAYMRTREELSRCTLRKCDADVKVSAY